MIRFKYDEEVVILRGRWAEIVRFQAYEDRDLRPGILVKGSQGHEWVELNKVFGLYIPKEKK
jgi:hypothetical protein